MNATTGYTRCCLRVLWACMMLANHELAAQSLFEDGKGKASLMLAGGSFLGINTGDASVQIGLTRLVNNRPTLYGLRGKAKSADGVSAIFAGGTIQPGVSLDGYAGWKLGGHRQLFLRAGYSRDIVVLFDSTAPFQRQVTKSHFDGFDGGLAYNEKAKGVWYFGFSAGVRRLSNASDLAEVTVTDLRSHIDSISGVTRQTKKDTKARDGIYRTGVAGYLDADVVRKLGATPAALRIFWRSTRGSDFSRAVVGVDVSLLRKNEVSNRVLGLMAQIDDIFHERKATSRLRERFSISLAASLPIGSLP